MKYETLKSVYISKQDQCEQIKVRQKARTFKWCKKTRVDFPQKEIFVYSASVHKTK